MYFRAGPVGLWLLQCTKWIYLWGWDGIRQCTAQRTAITAIQTECSYYYLPSPLLWGKSPEMFGDKGHIHLLSQVVQGGGECAIGVGELLYMPLVHRHIACFLCPPSLACRTKALRLQKGKAAPRYECCCLLTARSMHAVTHRHSYAVAAVPKQAAETQWGLLLGSANICEYHKVCKTDAKLQGSLHTDAHLHSSLWVG